MQPVNIDLLEPVSDVTAHPWSGGHRVTYREWVASVCLGDFTQFRQALQECPTIRPIGSCSTDLLGCHWLIRGQLSKNTAFAVYSPFAVAYNCHLLSASL